MVQHSLSSVQLQQDFDAFTIVTLLKSTPSLFCVEGNLGETLDFHTTFCPIKWTIQSSLSPHIAFESLCYSELTLHDFLGLSSKLEHGLPLNLHPQFTDMYTLLIHHSPLMRCTIYMSEPPQNLPNHSNTKLRSQSNSVPHFLIHLSIHLCHSANTPNTLIFLFIYLGSVIHPHTELFRITRYCIYMYFTSL